MGTQIHADNTVIEWMSVARRNLKESSPVQVTLSKANCNDKKTTAGYVRRRAHACVNSTPVRRAEAERKLFDRRTGPASGPRSKDSAIRDPTECTLSLTGHHACEVVAEGCLSTTVSFVMLGLKSLNATRNRFRFNLLLLDEGAHVDAEQHARDTYNY